jgi:hypothetical protein
VGLRAFKARAKLQNKTTSFLKIERGKFIKAYCSKGENPNTGTMIANTGTMIANTDITKDKKRLLFGKTYI